jgi:microcystin-dependent protein
MSEFFGLPPAGYNTPLLAASNLSDLPSKPTALTNLGAASSDDVLKAANPLGTIIAYYGSTAPYGYLPCSGQTVSSSTFPDLVTFLGGTTSATLPDLRGEFIRGWDNGRGIDTGRAIRTLQLDAFKSHTHSFPMQLAGASGSTTSTVGGSSTATTNATGDIETRPRNVSVLYCIKAYDSPKSASVVNMTSLVNEIAGRITPPLFDSTGNAATTTFVQRALGNLSGYADYNQVATATLSVNDLGKYIYAGAVVAGVLTLPAATAVPEGARYLIQSGTAQVTVITPSGTILGPNSLATDRIRLAAGTSSDLISNGTSWIATGGSGTFSKANNGYTVLPNGLIFQWGSIVIGDITTNASTTATLPIAFPNAHFQTFLTQGEAAAGDWVGYVITKSLTGFNYGTLEWSAVVQSATLMYFSVGY